MPAEFPPAEDNTAPTISSAKELVAKQIHLAGALVTPFAAAVAAELEDFGLTKQKVDEILLRSAKRFGSTVGETPLKFGGDDHHRKNDAPRDQADNNAKSAGYFAWFKSVTDQTLDFFSSVAKNQGPEVLAYLTPVVIAALQQSIENLVADALGVKSRPRRRSSR